MWVSTRDIELISDKEMNQILLNYNCHITDFGRKVTLNNKSWIYKEDDKNVLY